MIDKGCMMISLCILFFAVSPADALDVRLDVFGNANLDDIIDEEDIAYVKDIMKGSAETTELADANYDQEVDEEDIAQIERIINGTESSLTFIDIFGDAETVNKPINHVAALGYIGPQLLRLIGAEDRMLPVVGPDYSNYPVFWGEISQWHSVGNTPPDVDFEHVLSLSPDAVQTNLEFLNYANDAGRKMKEEFHRNLPGIPLICLNAREPEHTSATVLIYGYIFDEEEKARDFAAWHQETYNRIKRISDQIPEEDKPEVLFNSHELGTKYTAGGSRYDQSLKLAGARNLIDKIVKEDSPFYGKTSVDVEPEWVMEQNPEYIFTSYLNPNSNAGFETEDVSGAAESVQAISNQTEFSELDAIKNGNVYYIDNFLVGGGGLNPIGAAYLGKLLHPEEFEEIKPDELLREYLAFYSTETEPKGVFLYPSLEERV